MVGVKQEAVALPLVSELGALTVAAKLHDKGDQVLELQIIEGGKVCIANMSEVGSGPTAVVKPGTVLGSWFTGKSFHETNMDATLDPYDVPFSIEGHEEGIIMGQRLLKVDEAFELRKKTSVHRPYHCLSQSSS